MGEVPTRHEVCDAARSEDTSELPLSDNESPEGESDWVTTEESFFEFEEPHEAEVFHELGAGGLEADGLAEARNLKEARDLEILDLEIHGLEEIHRLGSLDLHSIDAQLESVARERETIGLVPGGDGLGRAAKALESDTKEPETLSTKEPEPRTPLPAKKLLSLDNKAPSELKPEEALNTKYPETPDTPTFTIALEYPQDEDSQEETSITEDSGSAPTELQNPSVDIAPQCATSSDHSKDPHEEVHPELVPIVISLHETATPGSPATTIILTTADADDLTPVENKMSGEYAYSRPRPRSSAARSIGDRSIVAVSFVSPEDEVLSLRVRSLYDCSPGGDASSQFSADTSQRRISRIVEEGAAGVSRQRGARSSFPGASKDIVHRSRVSRSVEDLSLSRRGSADRDEVTTFSKRSSVAGGIEDWEDLEGRDVDRYGFINHSYIQSSAPTPLGSKAAPKRIATQLFLQSQEPRKRPGLGLKTLRLSPSAPEMLKPPLPRRSVVMRDKENARSRKWRAMAVGKRKLEKGVHVRGNGAGVEWNFDTSDPKLISRTWKGIPDCWRGAAWYSFLAASHKSRRIGRPDGELINIYNELLERASSDDVQIDLDVPRTISSHIMFRRRYTGGQRLLFRVLHSLSLYFPEVGYVQGMASIAATLLCYYEEETTFVMLVRLWELRGLGKLYQSGFGGLMAALEEFECIWMKGNQISKKLINLGIGPTAYGTRWYLTLFNYSIPFAAQLRVWDVFMLLGDPDPGSKSHFDGTLDVLHATGAAILDGLKNIILKSDFEDAMKNLTSFIPVKDEDVLMRMVKSEWKMRKRKFGYGLRPSTARSGKSTNTFRSFRA